MQQTSKKFKVLFVSVAAVVAAAMVATVVAIRDRGVLEVQRELMSIAQEDAARRIRTTLNSTRRLNESVEKSAISAARTLARLVAADPSLATAKEPRLKALGHDLNVDEVCVINSNGVITASWPGRFVGYDMASAAQSAAFLPALTNANFELVQTPGLRGHVSTNATENNACQYAGVARRDTRGIVQIGLWPDRLEEYSLIADMRSVVSQVRIGRGGFVEIDRRSGGRVNESDAFVVRDGQRMLCSEASCEGWRIRVLVPVTWTPLADEEVFHTLVILDLLLVILLFVSATPRVVMAGLATMRSLVALVRGVDARAGKKKGSRGVAGAVIAASLLVFAVAVAVSWMVQSRAADALVDERLHSLIAEIHDTVEDSVGDMLAFTGSALCRRYAQHDVITPEMLRDVMDRYDLDEMNVVDEHGIVRAGALADVGYDMGSKPLTAEFNCLLHGKRVYAQHFRGAVEDPTIRCKYVGVAFPGKAKGYVQLGFAEKRLKDQHNYWFESVADGWRIPFKGFSLCASLATGEILSCGRPDFKRGVDTLASIGLDVAHVPRQPGKVFRATLYGTDCYCVQNVDFYHRFVVAIPAGEIARLRNASVSTFAAIIAFILGSVAFFLVRLVGLVTSLRHYIATDAERRRQDLALARTIQLSSLPVKPSEVADYGIYATMRPARDVGGDFYDYFTLPDGRVLVLIADVSGKGVPAAMFMMRAKATVRSAVAETHDLAEAVTRVNAALAENNEGEMFVTAWFGVYDRATGEIEYVNAGHNQPLVRRRDGSAEYLATRPGLVLAAMEGVKYRSARLALEPGDSLFLYTDGVTEAMNVAEELYGETRLKATLERSGKYFVNEILDDMAAYTKGAEQSDDITMLALDRRAKDDFNTHENTDKGNT